MRILSHFVFVLAPHFCFHDLRDVPTVVGSGRYRPPLRKNSHHSDKIATTTNSLTSTKIWKYLVSITSWFTQHIRMYIHSVYKEFPRHYLNIEIENHKFWKFKTHLYSHHSSKPRHITVHEMWLAQIFNNAQLRAKWLSQIFSNGQLHAMWVAQIFNSRQLHAIWLPWFPQQHTVSYMQCD